MIHEHHRLETACLLGLAGMALFSHPRPFLAGGAIGVVTARFFEEQAPHCNHASGCSNGLLQELTHAPIPHQLALIASTVLTACHLSHHLHHHWHAPIVCGVTGLYFSAWAAQKATNKPGSSEAH